MRSLVQLLVFVAVTAAFSYSLSGIMTPLDRVRYHLHMQVGQRKRRGDEVRAVIGARTSTMMPAIRHLLTRALDRRITGQRVAKDLYSLLRRADVKLQVSEFLLCSAAAGIISAGLVFAARRPLPLAIVALAAGILMPYQLVRQRIRQRVRAFDAQLPDCLLMLTNSLKSGYSLLQAIDVVARDMPPPVSREFAEVVRESRVGIPIEDSLRNLLSRMPSDDLDLVSTAILIQRQVGGNLGEVFSEIGATIRDRITIKGQIQTLTAEGRISGWVVGSLPIAIAGVILLFNPGYLDPMLKTGLGRMILGAGATMQVLGAFFIHRIINIEV